MNRKFIWKTVSVFIFSFLVFFAFTPRHAAGGGGEEDLFVTPVKPNVLIIMDNSNSMDEDFYGNAVGSYTTGSKSVEGKKVLNTIVSTYADKMRLGLMTYKLPGDITKQYLTNVLYFVSYDPRSYCPNPPDECVDYCRNGSAPARATCQTACQSQNLLFDATYIDDSITGFSYSADPTAARNRYCGLVYPKINRMTNPTDPTNYIYYKQALPLYSSYEQPDIAFWASPAYVANDSSPDTYDIYGTKTGTSDGIPTNPAAPDNGYSSYVTSITVVPTDSDFALGYNEFGRRQGALAAGTTWFSNASPGPGYLQIAVDENNPADNNQRNALLAKLKTYENDGPGYMGCTKTDKNQCPYIVNAGLTPTAGTLQSAIDYFKGNYAGSSTPILPAAGKCQKNYIVYVTDGLPSVDTSGNPRTADSLMPVVLQKLGDLRNLGYGGNTFDVKTFVVGLGLTRDAKVELNKMAVAGGTATGGQAYYADNPAQLQDALGKIFSTITQNCYSFSVNSVSAVRTSAENFTYQASFRPVTDDPFWPGNLRKFGINSDGSIGSMVWDAGEKLQAKPASARNIWTYVDQAVIKFDDPNWADWKKNLGVGNSNTVKNIMEYIRGEASSNPDDWKLGDMFHSNPITIGSPSFYFVDLLSPSSFNTFRENQKSRERIVVVGANDGQFRAFSGSSGEEKWSFIPPNLMPKLQYLAHFNHSTILPAHMYFVDGPVTVADVWLGSGSGTSKSPNDWRTLLVFAEGKGVRDSTNTRPDYLWSSAKSCDMNDAGEEFQQIYDNTHQYYCGYWAFDVTDTSATKPAFKWQINPSSSEAPYLGEPWSKMAIGRVIISGNEKWVGFIGGGNTNTGSSKPGRGFFVVDLKDGDILWSFTQGASDTSTTSATMSSPIPAPPAIVDTDNDGFVDTAYIGDLGGSIWRFKFCTQADGNGCNKSNWRGDYFFWSSTASPIYTAPSVARDQGGSVWVFWGTGDKENPMRPDSQDIFFGVKDNDRSGSYDISALENITNSIFIDAAAKHGWYIALATGEKVLADSAAFGGMITWTTFTPLSNDLCTIKGTSKLYAVALMPIVIDGVTYQIGAGLFATSSGNVPGTRSIALGPGIAQVPVYSQKPDGTGATDAYLTTGGGEGTDAGILSSAALANSPFKKRLQDTAPSTQVLHWWDQRVAP